MFPFIILFSYENNNHPTSCSLTSHHPHSLVLDIYPWYFPSYSTFHFPISPLQSSSSLKFLRYLQMYVKGLAKFKWWFEFFSKFATNLLQILNEILMRIINHVPPTHSSIWSPYNSHVEPHVGNTFKFQPKSNTWETRATSECIHFHIMLHAFMSSFAW